MDSPKSEDKAELPLCYTLSEKNEMLVVIFTGNLGSDSMPSLDVLRAEILRKEQVTQVVLFFQRVEIMSADVISSLTQLQRDIRQKPSELRICALSPSLKERLLKMGIVRGLELQDDLRTALLSFARSS